jgi:hypothetical protein
MSHPGTAFATPGSDIAAGQAPSMLVIEPLVQLSIGRSQSFSRPPDTTTNRLPPSAWLPKMLQSYPWARKGALSCMFTVGRLGLEPRTYGLKVRCSAS